MPERIKLKMDYLKHFILLTVAMMGLYQLNCMTTSVDPVTGRKNFEDTVAGITLIRTIAHIQELPLEDSNPNINYIIERLSKMSLRIPSDFPKNMIYYLEEGVRDVFSKDFPKNIVFSEAIIKEKDNNINIPEWVPPDFNIRTYKDNINGHHFNTLTIPLKNTEFKLKLPWQTVGTSASPNIYLLEPDPTKRTKENLFYLGTDPYRSHTNALGIEIKQGIRLIFGAGWLKPANIFDLDYEKIKNESFFYSLLVPSNYAMPATGIYEIKDRNITKHSDYSGDLTIEQDYSPVFLLFKNEKIKTLRGKQFSEILENPPSDGIIVQIANATEMNNNQLDMINNLQKLLQDSQNPILNEKINLLLNNLEDSLHSKFSTTKDVTWMILAETESGEQVLTFVLNQTHESEKTPSSYRITAGILETLTCIRNSQGNENIKSLQIINTGAEGSTSNVIMSRENGDIPDGVNTYSSLEELTKTFQESK